ncbi:unnamed protein product [Clavelina lepadiformis]|uniref:Uncharacterized protein n=1 Tax=Clavelina lepadiformis TaxID=159417 RepID=A0ABP0FCJ5_CLALP
MENEDWKWNVGYQQSSVFSLNQPTGSQFRFEACPYAEDHSSFAGQVSIRYLPHYWWTGNLVERLLVCQDVDGSLTIGRLAVGDGIHHPDGFKFANTSCCFKMIRDKWYPNTVVFGVTTIDSSLEYIQQ